MALSFRKGGLPVLSLRVKDPGPCHRSHSLSTGECRPSIAPLLLEGSLHTQGFDQAIVTRCGHPQPHASTPSVKSCCSRRYFCRSYLIIKVVRSFRL